MGEGLLSGHFDSGAISDQAEGHPVLVALLHMVEEEVVLHSDEDTLLVAIASFDIAALGSIDDEHLEEASVLEDKHFSIIRTDDNVTILLVPAMACEVLGDLL